ncbi:MAG: TonB-dependent receptor [Sphingomonadaceae bacterium]|nr:TonB-dependent receptor [Sphingomonadaceae bacterium]
MRLRNRVSLLLTTTASIGLAVPAMGQTSAEPQAGATGEKQPVIVVTGSRIQGAKIDDVLPITVLDADAIDAVAAGSGEELFAAIPQVGVTAFNEQNTTGGVNGARGDLASINLRELGTGNTLMLINGRRMNLHPGFQTELLVPVVSADTNEIAPGSVRRVEVLRDGASAIYGADAVAGVVNTILRGNRTGGFLEAEWRASDGTSLYSYTINGGYGFDFAGGKGNLTLYGGYFHESGMPVTDRDYARNSDLSALVTDPDFIGDSQFYNNSTSTPWGQFDIQASTTATPIRDDDFYLQPSTFAGCRMDFGNGVCARNGTTPATETRYNLNYGSDLFSQKDRYNAMALFNYELTPDIELYLEGSYYRSENARNNADTALLSAVPIGISRNAYWNPFGPIGSPNRLDGTTISASGANVIMERMRFVDVGNRQVSNTKNAWRVVAGLKGDLGGWDFDTGFVYSEARSNDLTRGRISNTLLQEAINRTTPDAYNPFNGGCIDNVSEGDCTPNPQSVIDDITVDVFRKGGTSLALADFKVSKPDLFALPGGDLGLAAGVEWRRESFFDDRDPRLDGTITFTDSITGEFNGSDVVGSSPSPDTSGSRNVLSAYAELLLPLVGPDMNIPLVYELNVQAAGRVEKFSDINRTAAVPRIAASWTVTPGLMFRGAWSQGFRAPNLVQVNDAGTTRVNTRDDYVRCYAQVIQGQIADLGSCGGTGTVSYRSGTDQLKPEDSDSINLGVVLSPGFLRGLTLTADYWEVRQRNLVGVFGDDNALALDLLLRLSGSSNPNVIRRDPTSDDDTLFAGTGLASAGTVIQVLDPYLNLDRRVSKGWDFGLFYDVPDFGLGEFDLRFNAARLKSAVQSPGEQGQVLLDAIASGDLPSEAAALGNLGQLLEIEGRPKWRFSGSVNWKSGGWRATLFGRYVGSVYDTSVTQDTTSEFYQVKSWFVTNASISYTIKNDTALDGTRIKFGINNLFDKDPPLADETYGFFSELHSARGRQFIVSIRKEL